MDNYSDELLHHIASEVSRIQHQFKTILTPEQLYLQLTHSNIREELEELCDKVRPAAAGDPQRSYDPAPVRPVALECDVVRFQNNKDKWIAFVGLKDGRPYEIFTGLADDEYGIMLPKSVTHGKIIRAENEDGTHRYDFQFVNTRGFKTTVEGLSYRFDRVFWNYAKLLSGVLRYGMPVEQVVKLLSSPQLDNDNINSWTAGVSKALKRYVTSDTTLF